MVGAFQAWKEMTRQGTLVIMNDPLHLYLRGGGLGFFRGCWGEAAETCSLQLSYFRQDGVTDVEPAPGQRNRDSIIYPLGQQLNLFMLPLSYTENMSTNHTFSVNSEAHCRMSQQ